MKQSVLSATALALCVGLAGCNFRGDISLDEKPAPAKKMIERTVAVSHVPMEIKRGKYYVQAVANGTKGEFIFDTGSPTIFSSQFAQKIGLNAVGRNKGVDANGTQLTMDIAVLERLDLGGTIFRNVPVLVHDFSGLDVGHCFITDGVLGSELLPGSAWRIDHAAAKLSIAANATALGVSTKARREKLHDTGYPHLPIIDYRVGGVAEKALFDTGNSERVVLFKAVANNPQVHGAIAPGTTMIGAGYQGESAGGMGQVEELARFTLKQFEIGSYILRDVRATTRAHPPTLVGAGIMQDHVVTLDYPNGAFILEPRGRVASTKAEAGYSISYRNGQAEVVQLYKGSKAAHAGLKLGDKVHSINGRSATLPKSGDRCGQINWLIGQFDPRKSADLRVVRDGQVRRIYVPKL